MNIVSAVQRRVERSHEIGPWFLPNANPYIGLASLFLPKKFSPPPDTTYQKIVRLRAVYGDIDRSIGGLPVHDFGERIAEVVLFHLEPYTQDQIFNHMFYEGDRLDHPASFLPITLTSQLGKSGVTYRDINYILSGTDEPPKEMTNAMHLFLALSSLVFSEFDKLEKRHQAHALNMDMFEAAYRKAGCYSGAHPFNEPERTEFAQMLERVKKVIGLK